MGDLPSRPDRIKEAEQILRSRLNFQGTTLGFSTEKTDVLWWLMISSDVNAVRAVLSLLPLERWKEDLPRIVQGALGRQRNGRWDLTLANAWGMMAMEKFSKAFEATSISGSTRATLSSQSQVTDWSTSPQGKVLSLPVADEKGRSFSYPSGNRKTLGHLAEPCGDSSQRVSVQWVQDKKNGHSDGT